MENGSFSPSVIVLHFLRLLSSVPYFLLVNLLHLFHPFLLVHVFWTSACSHCYLLLNWSISFLRHSVQSWRHYSRYSYQHGKCKKITSQFQQAVIPSAYSSQHGAHLVYNNMTSLHVFTLFYPLSAPRDYLINYYLVGCCLFCICSVHAPCLSSMSFTWACSISSWFGDHPPVLQG